MKTKKNSKSTKRLDTKGYTISMPSKTVNVSNVEAELLKEIIKTEIANVRVFSRTTKDEEKKYEKVLHTLQLKFS